MAADHDFLRAVEVDIAQLQEQMKVANHRIGDLEEVSKAIVEQNTKLGDMNTTLQVMVSQIKDIKLDVNENRKNMEKIKEKPTKEYDAIKIQVVSGFILLVAGLLVGKIM